MALPHDWLTWRTAGAAGIDALTTDRGEASGTGYWSPLTGGYRRDLLVRALGKDVVLPTVLGPADSPGTSTSGAVLGAGTGDNMAAAPRSWCCARHGHRLHRNVRGGLRGVRGRDR
ncbi:MAG: hypothetical protein WKF47_12715 [Geodermatophilaceae bacterium]